MLLKYAREFSRYLITSHTRASKSKQSSGAPNDNFRKNICSGDDLRSRIFGTFVVKFHACLPLLGLTDFYPKRVS